VEERKESGEKAGAHCWMGSREGQEGRGGKEEREEREEGGRKRADLDDQIRLLVQLV
jgi:hypothetical protein